MTTKKEEKERVVLTPEQEEARKAHISQYQADRRETQRTKQGLGKGDIAKELQTMSFEELEDRKADFKRTDVRVCTQSSKMNLYELAVLRQWLAIEDFRSVRELIVHHAELAVNNHKAKLAKKK